MKQRCRMTTNYSLQRFPLAITMTVCIELAVAPSCLQRTQRSGPAIGPLPSTPIPVAQSADMPNDNSLCLVCHVNFAEGDSIAGHISRRITCAHCHGKSIDHMNDESLMTPPDTLYGRSEVETMCRQCHADDHKDPQAVEAFIERWAGEKRENGRNVTEDSICTDCHGRHTIPRR